MTDRLEKVLESCQVELAKLEIHNFVLPGELARLSTGSSDSQGISRVTGEQASELCGPVLM